MKEEIIGKLRCPVCHCSFETDSSGTSLFCKGAKKRHCFDISASGYVNFAPPSKNCSGDSKEAVRSRTSFLELGYYEPIRSAVCDILAEYGAKSVLDAGCGEGYYTNEFASVADTVVGFDLSKFGVEAAAKFAKRNRILNSFLGVAGIYDMPVADESFDAVVSLFAPCAEEEFSRVLKKGGILIMVGAGENHLIGLKKAIYSTTYTNTDRADIPVGMSLIGERTLKYDITVEGNSVIKDLFSMTPYYYRTSRADLENLEGLERVETPVEVRIGIYANRGGSL